MRVHRSRRTALKPKLLPLTLAGAGVVLVVNEPARRRATSLVRRAVGALRRVARRGGDDRTIRVSTYRSVPAGDVDSEDPAGSWADDGGGGQGGGQASPVTGSAPLPPER